MSEFDKMQPSDESKKPEDEEELLEKTFLIDGKYSLCELLMKNSKCRVYKGRDLEGQDVAVKVKKTDERKELAREFGIYNRLRGGDGIPDALFQGFAEGHHFLVLPLLGETLSRRLWTKGTFTPKEARDVGLQVIKALKYMHQHHFIHLDVTPSNIVYAAGSDTTVFLIDFGFSEQFELPDEHGTFHHCAPVTDVEFFGSLDFASLNVHNGDLSFRRDDIISLGYIIIMLLSGTLPWHREVITVEEAGQEKVDYPPNVLCRRLPRSVLKYMDYAASLAFDEEPDYDKLSGFLSEMTKTDYWSWLLPFILVVFVVVFWILNTTYQPCKYKSLRSVYFFWDAIFDASQLL